MFGASSTIEGCRESGSDVVEGWYDRCSGLGLLDLGKLSVLSPLRLNRTLNLFLLLWGLFSFERVVPASWRKSSSGEFWVVALGDC